MAISIIDHKIKIDTTRLVTRVASDKFGEEANVFSPKNLLEVIAMWEEAITLAEKYQRERDIFAEFYEEQTQKEEVE